MSIFNVYYELRDALKGKKSHIKIRQSIATSAGIIRWNEENEKRKSKLALVSHIWEPSSAPPQKWINPVTRKALTNGTTAALTRGFLREPKRKNYTRQQLKISTIHKKIFFPCCERKKTLIELNRWKRNHLKNSSTTTSRIHTFVLFVLWAGNTGLTKLSGKRKSRPASPPSSPLTPDFFFCFFVKTPLGDFSP